MLGLSRDMQGHNSYYGSEPSSSSSSSSSYSGSSGTPQYEEGPPPDAAKVKRNANLQKIWNAKQEEKRIENARRATPEYQQMVRQMYLEKRIDLQEVIGTLEGELEFYRDPKNKLALADAINKNVRYLRIEHEIDEYKGPYVGTIRIQKRDRWPIKPDIWLERLSDKLRKAINDLKSELVNINLTPDEIVAEETAKIEAKQKKIKEFERKEQERLGKRSSLGKVYEEGIGSLFKRKPPSANARQVMNAPPPTNAPPATKKSFLSRFGFGAKKPTQGGRRSQKLRQKRKNSKTIKRRR